MHVIKVRERMLHRLQSAAADFESQDDWCVYCLIVTIVLLCSDAVLLFFVIHTAQHYALQHFAVLAIVILLGLVMLAKIASFSLASRYGQMGYIWAGYLVTFLTYCVILVLALIDRAAIKT